MKSCSEIFILPFILIIWEKSSNFYIQHYDRADIYIFLNPCDTNQLEIMVKYKIAFCINS